MNLIHPTAIIGESVIIGNNNYIGPYCFITGNTVIGDNNRFEAFCTIGTPAQDRSVIYNFEKEYPVRIGNNNVFREYCQVHSGTKNTTDISDNCLFLVNSHISHDSVIENNVTIGNNTVLGGHTIVMEGANIGLGSLIHQNSIIGAYSMIGMGSVITKHKKVEPGHVVAGNPIKFIKINTIGLSRNNVTTEQFNNLKKRYNTIYETI